MVFEKHSTSCFYGTYEYQIKNGFKSLLKTINFIKNLMLDTKKIYLCTHNNILKDLKLSVLLRIVKIFKINLGLTVLVSLWFLGLVGLG